VFGQVDPAALRGALFAAAERESIARVGRAWIVIGDVAGEQVGRRGRGRWVIVLWRTTASASKECQGCPDSDPAGATWLRASVAHVMEDRLGARGLEHQYLGRNPARLRVSLPPLRQAHSSGIVKLLINVGGSPLKGGIFARRNTILTQLPVSVSRNLAVRISTDCTSPS